MARTKKRTKSNTPRRKSTQKITRTAKGIYYDQHLQECIDKPSSPVDPGVLIVKDEVKKKPETVAENLMGEAATPGVCETTTPIIGDEDESVARAAIESTKSRSKSDSQLLFVHSEFTTPVRVVQGTKPQSLMEELDIALSGSALPCDRKKKCGIFKFPDSVATVDQSLVKEIDFDVSREQVENNAMDNIDEEILHMLRNTYDLHEIYAEAKTEEENLAGVLGIDELDKEEGAVRSEVEADKDIISVEFQENEAKIAVEVEKEAERRKIMYKVEKLEEENEWLKKQVFSKDQKLV